MANPITVNGSNYSERIANTLNAFGLNDNVIINALGGDDYIVNNGCTVSIDAGAGNDTILNGKNENGYQDNVTLNGGDGNDYIYNHNAGDFTTIFGGNGNDTINNNGDTIKIDSGAGNDYIFSYSYDGTIEGGTGNDTITISDVGDRNLIIYNNGDGNDVINGFDGRSTLKIGNGNSSYSTQKSGDDIIVNVEDGKITLKGAANLSAVNIDGARLINVAQSINISQNNVVLVGNDSANKIENYGSNVTIQANGGNDSIYNNWNSLRNTPYYDNDGSNVLFLYRMGDGNDSIWGFKENSTLSIVGGIYSTQQSGSNIIVTVDDGNGGNEGKISLRGAANLSTVNIVGGKQRIYVDNIANSRSNIMIVGNDSPNTISNDGSNVTIRANDGNDSIGSNGARAMISGGAGDDSISNPNKGDNSAIEGGAGNDSIYNAGSDVTINAGEGNDSIYNNWNFSTNKPYVDSDGSNVVFNYTAGDGNDIIHGFKESSTLNLAGTGYISTKSGNDIILTVSDGKITLAGAANLSKVNIVEKPLNITKSKSDASIIGTAHNDSIKNTGAKVTVVAQGGNDFINNDGANSSLNGEAGNDSVINSAANVTINAGTGNDTVSVNKASGNLIQYNNGDGRDVITSFNEKSSLSVSGANYASAKYGDNVFVKVGDGIITIRGGAELTKVNIIGTADQSKTFNNTKNNDLLIANDLDNTISNSGDNVTILATGGNDSIYNAWGSDTILIEAGDGFDTVQSWGSTMTINASNGNDYIYNHGGNINKYDGGAGDDTIISEGNGFNSTILGGSGNDYLRNDSGSNVTMSGGKGNDTLKNDGANAVFRYELGDGYDVIEGFRADSTLDIIGANYATEKSGNDLLVYIGDGAEVTLKGAASLYKVNINGVEDKSKKLKENKANTSMVGSNYADTLEHSGKNVTIMGNAGNDSIKSSGANSSIDGSRGNDKIENGGESSIVEGGLGNDSIFNNKGHKSLVDGGEGNDTVNNKATSATIFGGAGNDSLYNGDYGNKSIFDGGDGNDTIKNTVSLVSISGGAGNDSINNSDRADNPDVTINAGAGNDTIDNDSQKILFQYHNGDGNDVINGFNATSTLSIDGGVKDNATLSVLGGTKAVTSKSNNDLIVTVENGKVTLKNAANLSTVNIVETPINFSNDRNKVTVNGTNANDTITNVGEKIAIIAQGGNDSIINNNKGVNSTIEGGADDDNISNTAKNVTLTGQSGNDSIYNNAGNVSMAGAEGNDSLFSNGENVTIAGGAGNDTVENYTGSNKVTIDGGAGDDSVSNAGHNVTITGGAGNDTLSNNSGTAVSMAGGDGNDVINVKGAYQNTITGGTGDDTISVDWSSNEALIIYNKGDGNDYISNFNGTSTLQIGDGSGTYSTQQSGDDIIVNVDIDKITLKGAAKLSQVNIAGRAKLNLNNTQSAVEILGSELNDDIVNSGFNVTINVYGGHDTINNLAHETTIDAGAGNDHIENRNNNDVTINAGDGADAVVSKAGFRNTITAGAGNDSIDVSSSEEDLINYRAGDGNDYIVGFNKTTSLRIAGEVFSTSKSNEDLIVTVGKEKITLEGAATVSPLNILGVEDVYLDATNSANETLLVGTIFKDTIRNSGSNVTIAARDGNDSIHNGYWNKGCSNVTIDAGAGNDTVINENSASVSIDAGEGNDYIENKNGYLTIKAGDGNDKIFNDYAGINSTLDGGAGNDSIVNRAYNTTIDSGEGNDTIYNNWDIKKGVALNDDNEEGSNVLFKYKTGDGYDVIYGFKNSSTLLIDDGNGIYTTQKSGDDIIVNVEDGKITLKGAANLKKVDIVGKNPVNVNNSSNNISIVGTSGNDTVKNNGANVTIQAGGGKDTVENYGSNAKIYGGEGDDTLWNDYSGAPAAGSGVLLDGGNGNDRFSNDGKNSTVLGGEGNDSIRNYGTDSTVNGGEGNDSIWNDGANSKLEGDTGDDTISNYVSNVTIDGGDGNDYIYNHNAGDFTTIFGGNGNDSIYNNGDTISIDGGAGNDSIYNAGSDVTISGGAGNDTISNEYYASYALINGGAGNDSIYNAGSDVTINAGAGNDTIYNNWNFYANTPYHDNDGSNVVFNYAAGDGNDIIHGFKENSTLQIGDGTGTYSSQKSGSDIIVTVGEGKITLQGAANLPAVNIAGAQVIKFDSSVNNSRSNVMLVGNDSANNIYNSGSKVLINALGGNDSIENYFESADTTILGGAGKDSIWSNSWSITVDGGTDDDTIYSGYQSSYISISGGAGDDSISNAGSDVTINGDDGNDTINNEDDNVLFNYAAGDGNDIIHGFKENSTLSISGGGYSTQKSGSDIIVTVDDGKITLQGAANLKKVNIAGVAAINVDNITNLRDNIMLVGNDSANNIYNIGSNVTIQAKGGNDSIYTNNGEKIIINGDAGNDSIENRSYISTVNGGAGNDSIFSFRPNTKINAGEGNDTIYNNWNFYGNTPYAGNNGSNVLFTYSEGDGFDVIYGFRADSTLSISGGGYSTQKSGSDIIVTVDDGKITLKGAATLSTVNIAGTQIINVDTNINNSQSNVVIVGNDSANTIYNAGSNVTISGGAGNDSIKNNSSSVVIDAGDNNDTINNDANNVTISGGEGNDSIQNYGSNLTMSGGTGNDKFLNWGNNNKVYGEAGNDSIANSSNSKNTSIFSGAGNDTIRETSKYGSMIDGGVGNDVISLVSDSKNAFIVYQAGDDNDIIYGFRENSTLSISGGSYSTQVSGSDIIVTVGDGKITLKGAANLSTVNIASSPVGVVIENKKRNAMIYGGTGNDSVYNSRGGSGTKIDLGDGDDFVTNDAANTTITGGAGNDYLATSRNVSGVIIKGDTGNDYIENGDGNLVNGTNKATMNGGEGADTISNRGYYSSVNGGADNDDIYNNGANVTIEGGEGDDSISNEGDNVLFNYAIGDGNDIIKGFRANSTLSIASGKKDYATRKSGSDIIVTVDDGKITLQGAANLSNVNILKTEYNPVSIKNYDDKVSVVGSQFDDSIENYGTDVTILAHEDGDYITNKALAASIIGEAGNDTIVNVGSNNTINSGADNDSIVNYSKYSVIEAGAGDDYVENDRYGISASIMGGAGNDSIENWAIDSTIEGGTGSDTINLSLSSDNALINYTAGDGNDLINGFRANSTLSISGGKYNLERTNSDIIVTIGEERITLAGAATLSAPKIIGEQEKSDQYFENSTGNTIITGTALNDTIANSGRKVTIQALEGDDSIKNYNSARSVSIDSGAGNDTIENKHGISLKADAGAGNDSIYSDSDYSSINAGAGNDTVYNSWSRYSTIYGGAGDDYIYSDNAILNTISADAGNDTIALNYADEIFITYNPGDGNDLIQGFSETSTLSLGTDYFSPIISGNDVIISIDEENITLEGAATMSALHIIGTEVKTGTYANFAVEGSEVTYDTDGSESIIKRAYKFNEETMTLTLNKRLEDYFVTVNNNGEEIVKVNWHYGKASLNSESVLEYHLEDGENNVTLASDNYEDKISFDEDVKFHYGEIEGSVFSGSALKTTEETAISFNNNSSASLKAGEGSQIRIGAGEFTVNEMPVKSTSGKGKITVADGLKFEGSGVQMNNLEIAKESYFEKVTPMVAAYDIYEDIYTLQNTACVKTLAKDFITLKFDLSVTGEDNYAYYKVNGKEFLVASDEDDINVVEVQDSIFKIQDREIDTEKISRVTIDEQISIKGTEINFNDVEVIYAQGKTVSYTLDGEEVSINNGATVMTTGDAKTFNCEAGSYVINGKSFETSADLTFTADENQIIISLANEETEIYFDGMTISGVSEGGELVFDLINEEIYIPNGAAIKVDSPDEMELNLAAGEYTINDNEISSGVEIKITADKDNVKVPLSEDAVTINGATITGDDEANIDSHKIITLPDGALVESISENIYKIEDNGAIFFDTADKSVLLTDEGAAYVKYTAENLISVGFNSVIFENVEIYGNDAWTIETSGTEGIDKITGITDGATIGVAMTEGSEGDLNFDIETEGNGEFIICDQKFTSTGDAENIFTVSKAIIDSENSTVAVTAITKKLGTVSGNFENGIQINAQEDDDTGLVKATNNDKDIELELDSDGKLSVEKIEDGANVEEYGQAEKIVTIKNDKEYTLQIGDYKYTINGDLDNDGITFELIEGDFKVRKLYDEGTVTRYNVNDSDWEIWTWNIEQDKWIGEQIAEDAPYEITINADKTLSLIANGILVNRYSDQVIASPASGTAVENGITITAKAIDGTTTFANNCASPLNIYVESEDDQIISALAEKASVQVDKNSFTLKSENTTGTTFKVDGTLKTLRIADNFKIDYSKNSNKYTEIKLTSDNNDIELSDSAKVTAPAGKKIKFGAESGYTVNGITFDATEGTEAETIQRGIKFDLSTGTVEFDSLSLEGGGTAQISQQNPEMVMLTDGSIVKALGDNKFKYYNRRFAFEGAVEIVGKKFDSDKQVKGGLIYFETSEAQWNEDGTYTTETYVTTGFVVGSKYVEIQTDFYDGVKIVNEEITAIEGVKDCAVIAGNGSANISIVTTESGTFTIGGKTYKISNDSDGVTFVTDSNGNVSKVNGLSGTIEGDFGNEINVNGKAIQVSGASTIKVATDGKIITEISDVAGDLVTTDSTTYRKDVRVISAGGAEKLTTSADGTIIFNGKSFSTSAGKIFTLDEMGNVSKIDAATKVLAAFNAGEETQISMYLERNSIDMLESVKAAEITENGKGDLGVEGREINTLEGFTGVLRAVSEGSGYKEEKLVGMLSGEENLGTMTLSTTEGLEEVIGDFSEGLLVNGVFVRVTDSSNFVVKDDVENIYVETRAADTFTINGKTFKTSADKTIFKLDARGAVSEIVTDKFLPNEEAYLIEGDFNEEIIFNGQKFCVTGSNETRIFVGEETQISVDLARNSINIVESGKSAEIAVNGKGDLGFEGRQISTSEGFTGVLRAVSEGKGYKVEKLVGTMSGKLGGLEILGVTIESEDKFSVTGDGEKVIEIENLKNGSLTSDNLEDLTINGEKISVDASQEEMLTVTNGKLKISDEKASIAEKFLETLTEDEYIAVVENITLSGSDVAVVEDTSGKVSITASKGSDTIYTSGENVAIDLKACGATKIYAAQGRATVENYNAKSGAAFLTENENIAEAIEENAIAYDNGKLTVNAARVTFADEADSRLINFVDTKEDTQKVGFVGNGSKIDASKETADLILIGGSDSTILGGRGSDTIYGEAGTLINAGAGKNLIKLSGEGETIIEMNGRDSVMGFKNSFEDGDIIKTSTENLKLKFDGENIVAKNNAGKMTLSGGAGETFAELLLLDGTETLKTYVAQGGENILIGDETAQAYYGKKSGVDFSGYSETLALDLSENFYGINKITVGGGLNTLISSSANETLTGNSSGITEYGFSAGDGRDLIQNFNFEEDKINVGTNAVTDVRLSSEGKVRLKVGLGDDWLTIADAQGKAFKVNDVVALVDKNITYDDTANYFVATGRNATMTVNESAEIWLDGSHGKTFVGVKIVDASTVQGKISLVGNDSDNELVAGNGDASLWGGTGGDDLLIGGASKNTFFYASDNGNDTITGANDGDEIILSGVTLEQISGTSITSGGVAINFVDGCALQVKSNRDVIYELGDGTRYSANHEQSEWQKK